MIDVSFRISGVKVPSDHGYSLYSTLSRLLPNLHEAEWLSIHPINGFPAGDRTLRLSTEARLQLRLPPERLPFVLPLAGKRIVLSANGSEFRISLGIPEVFELRPASVLHSRCVIIKLSESTKNKTHPDKETFVASAQTQLRERGINGEISIDDRRNERGHDLARRVIHIKDQIIVGYAMRVAGLGDEDSLKLQERGLGGKHRMGCGVFVPVGPL